MWHIALAFVAILTTAQAFAEPSLFQNFIPNQWTGVLSNDGHWRINGPWIGTGGNLMDPQDVLFDPSIPGYAHAHGFVEMLVPGGQTPPYHGAEIQSIGPYQFSYGYYETRLRVTSVPGVVVSFFWIEAPNYGPHEWDIEFTTDTGELHYTIHPGNSVVQPLAFNPAGALHKYGFLWTAGKLQYTIDRQIVYTFNSTALDKSSWANPNANGFLMANTWTGNPNWGGGPPAATALSTYDWFRYIPNAIAVPPRRFDEAR